MWRKLSEGAHLTLSFCCQNLIYVRETMISYYHEINGQRASSKNLRVDKQAKQQESRTSTWESCNKNINQSLVCMQMNLLLQRKSNNVQQIFMKKMCL